MVEPTPRYEVRQSLQSVKVGTIFGFATCLAYPLAVFAHLPRLATVTLVACFGPALGFACYGLRRLLEREEIQIDKGGGDRNGKYLVKACVLNMLQPASPINWNKRNTAPSAMSEVYPVLRAVP